MDALTLPKEPCTHSCVFMKLWFSHRTAGLVPDNPLPEGR